MSEFFPNPRCTRGSAVAAKGGRTGRVRLKLCSSRSRRLPLSLSYSSLTSLSPLHRPLATMSGNTTPPPPPPVLTVSPALGDAAAPSSSSANYSPTTAPPSFVSDDGHQHKSSLGLRDNVDVSTHLYISRFSYPHAIVFRRARVPLFARTRLATGGKACSRCSSQAVGYRSLPSSSPAAVATPHEGRAAQVGACTPGSKGRDVV